MAGGEFVVRLLTPADRELFSAWLERWGETRTWDAHRGVDVTFLEHPSAVAFAAFTSDGIVASAWGYRQPRPDGQSYLQLYSMHVAEGARRLGIGRALVEAFLELARREGHSRMWLYTGDDNEAAKALYEHTGGGRSLQDDVHYWWQIDGTSTHPD